MSSSLQIRPKYKKDSTLTPNLIADEIKLKLNTSKNVTGRVINNQVYLKLPKEESKYWSPELNVKITNSDKGSIINGFAGPNSNVWATFMVLYGLAVALFLFGELLGISEKMLGIDSYWILSVPGSIILFVLVFLASKIGERMGANQLIMLRNFLDEAIISAEKQYDTK